jgi:hypothetical protein
MIDQSIKHIPSDPFICIKCTYYKGDIKCDCNYFISFYGQDTSKCKSFEEGKLCKHYGLLT